MSKSGLHHLRLIGDVHGRISDYVKLAQEAEYSIQVGDLGFEYHNEHGRGEIDVLDPVRHRVIGGNHDDYTTLDGGLTFHRQPPHYLGDFGTVEFPGVPKIFYMRGARSIDQQSRTEGWDWWPEEELSYRKMNEALVAYNDLKPEFVITHECPAFLVSEVTRFKAPLRPSNTANALEAMFENHTPQAWFFGHFHNNWSMTFKGTYFRCLDICATYDIESRVSSLKRANE